MKKTLPFREGKETTRAHEEKTILHHRRISLNDLDQCLEVTLELKETIVALEEVTIAVHLPSLPFFIPIAI